MSTANVHLVQRLYDLWNEGASMADLLDPQFEWVSPPDAVEPGTLQGRCTGASSRDWACSTTSGKRSTRLG